MSLFIISNVFSEVVLSYFLSSVCLASICFSNTVTLPLTLSTTIQQLTKEVLHAHAYVNIYAKRQGQAQAVNKLNIVFSPSVSNKVYLAANLIVPDNY